MNVGIVGTGYVGLVTGTCLAEFGCNVVCADRDHDKIERLGRGEPTIWEPGLGELLQKNLREGRLRFTVDVAEAVQASLVLFIAVGTPPRGDGWADLQFVEDVARLIGKHLDGYKVVVTKSTVPVGTGRWIRRLIEEELAARQVAPAFDVAANPEFLRRAPPSRTSSARAASSSAPAARRRRPSSATSTARSTSSRRPSW